MHVAPALQVTLPCHRIVVDLTATRDRALPLRMVSLLHRRGVPVLAMHLDDHRFTAVFRSTVQHARVLEAGFGGIVGVLAVHLDLGPAPMDVSPRFPWCGIGPEAPL